MPVHAEDASQRLEPERMRKPSQDAVRSFMQHERLDDDRAEPGHALREPGRYPAAMQGQVRAASACSHTPVQYARRTRSEATLTCVTCASVPAGPRACRAAGA